MKIHLKLHSQRKQMGRQNLKESMAVRENGERRVADKVRGDISNRNNRSCAVDSKPTGKHSHTSSERIYCIFYQHKKCIHCGLCEEIEKPSFNRRFEAGLIDKPMKKGAT